MATVGGIRAVCPRRARRADACGVRHWPRSASVVSIWACWPAGSAAAKKKVSYRRVRPGGVIQFAQGRSRSARRRRPADVQRRGQGDPAVAGSRAGRRRRAAAGSGRRSPGRPAAHRSPRTAPGRRRPPGRARSSGRTPDARAHQSGRGRSSERGRPWSEGSTAPPGKTVIPGAKAIAATRRRTKTSSSRPPHPAAASPLLRA